MTVENLNSLREEVERVFGRRILSASDCQHLSNDINNRIKASVSLNTLRRFFQLMKSEYQPSSFTLNLLSKYCSFSSFEDFISYKQRIGNTQAESGSDLLNFLVLLFRDLDTRGVEDSTYISLIQEIINNLERWPKLIDAFQRQIAKTANGQLFYFEQFVNIDKLNSYYGNGLRYYLHEKKDSQAQVFGRSLLCFRNWLSMQKKDLEYHYHELSKYSTGGSISPAVSARYFAASLYHAEMNAADPEKILSDARDFYLDSKSFRNSARMFPQVEFILAEALILTGQYEESLFYIEEALKKKSSYKPTAIDIQLFESILLFQAIAYRNVGREQRARDIFEKISIKNFCFLSRKLYMILYLVQKKPANKKDFAGGQLDYLIKQTGFKKLISGFPEVLDLPEAT